METAEVAASEGAAARPPGGPDATTDGPTRRGGWGLDAAIVGGLAVVFVVAFVLFREQPFHYDPIEYFLTAQRFESAAPFHRSLRIGLLGPVRLVQVLIGYSQAAYYAVPMASGLLLLASTYALGRVMASRAVGAAAAVLVTFTAPVFGAVHQLWPDLPATAVFTAAMAATTVLCKRYGGDEQAGDAWGFVLFAAAGLLVGWSYLIRELTAVLFPVVLLPFWQYRTSWRYLVAGMVGAAAAFGGELAFNARFHGDALIRVRDLLAIGTEPPPEHVRDLYAARAAGYGGFLNRLGVFPGHLTGGRVPLLAGAGALALASPFVARRPQRRAMVVLLCWVLFYWGLLLYLSLDVDEYGRSFHLEKLRYWYPVLPPVVVAGCAGAAAIISRLPGAAVRRGLAVVLGLVVVFGVGADFVPLVTALDRGLPHPYEQVRRWLATDGSQYDSIATTQRSRWVLEVYTRDPFGRVVWDGRLQALNTARRFVGPQRVDTDLVLVDDTFFEARRSNWREVTPDWLLDLPDEWRPVVASDDGEVVVYERLAAPLDLAPVGAWSSRSDAVAVDSAGAAAVDLAAGQRANVSVRVAPGAQSGTVVLTEFDVTTAGEGNVVPFCSMVDATGARVRRDASSLWGVGFVDQRRMQAACTVPRTLRPPVEVRLGLGVSGPMSLRTGPADAAEVVTPTAWRTSG